MHTPPLNIFLIFKRTYSSHWVYSFYEQYMKMDLKITKKSDGSLSFNRPKNIFKKFLRNLPLFLLDFLENMLMPIKKKAPIRFFSK